MIYLIFGVLTFFSLLFPRSKVVCVCFFIFMWMLWGWNSWNGDYIEYQNMFNNPNQIGLEHGYRLLNSFFKWFNFGFQDFMISYSLIVLSLVNYFSLKSSYPALFSFLYFLIFIMEYVFMRNYMANTLFLIFIIVLLERNKHFIYKSLFILFIALSFHNSAILFFIFLLIPLKWLSTRKIIFITLGLIVLIPSAFVIATSFISSDMLKGKLEHYTTGQSPIGPALSHFIVVFSVVYFVKRSKKMLFSMDDKAVYIVNLLQRFAILSLIYVPIYFIIPDFSRFFRVLFPIVLFLILFLIYHSREQSKRLILYVFLLGVFSIVIYQFYYSTLNLTYFPLLNSNILFSDI